MADQEVKVTPDELEILRIKNAKIGELLSTYREFCERFSNLDGWQFPEMLTGRAMMSFDTGILWMKEAIMSAEVIVTKEEKAE